MCPGNHLAALGLTDQRQYSKHRTIDRRMNSPVEESHGLRKISAVFHVLVNAASIARDLLRRQLRRKKKGGEEKIEIYTVIQ